MVSDKYKAQEPKSTREAAMPLDELERATRVASTFRDYENIRFGIESLPTVPEFYKQTRIAVLRNFTIEPWIPVVSASLFADRIIGRFWLGDFDVFEDYLRKDSPLVEFRPDFILLAFESRTLFKDLYHAPPWDRSGDLASFPEHFTERLSHMISSLSVLSSAQIIVTNLVSPAHDWFQPSSHQVSASCINTIRKINCLLPLQAEENPHLSVFDMDSECSRFGIERSFDRNMWFFAANPFTIEFILSAASSLGDFIGLFHRPPKKCIVLDLDNTLWGGILGEDGEKNLKIGTSFPGVVYREFQMFLKGLRRKGILLAINSKNNEADCLEFFRSSRDMVLRETDFSAIRINWNEKVENMKGLAQELALGLDSFIFIDDSPYECGSIKAFLPEVSVYQIPTLPMEIPQFICGIKGVQSVRVLEEDAKRSEYYLAEKQRRNLEKRFQDADAFLKHLNIELTIELMNDKDIQRIAQLTQKTNQFNLTTRRYTESDINEFCKHGNKIITLRMKDIFGDYGLVGVAILRLTAPNVWLFDTLLLSCRVLGRSVEYAFVNYCMNDIKKSGGQLIIGEYLRTEKNEQVRDLYSRFNFRTLRADTAAGSYAFDLYKDIFVQVPDYIAINA